MVVLQVLRKTCFCCPRLLSQLTFQFQLQILNPIGLYSGTGRMFGIKIWIDEKLQKLLWIVLILLLPGTRRFALYVIWGVCCSSLLWQV